MTTRLFDLNIERLLDNWGAQHAIREVISNALDEQILSSTDPIRIFKDSRGAWHIRDFGRGLRIEHFTLNENKEKLSRTAGIIGKFGVGLKDALATFHRRGVPVSIASSHGRFQLSETSKHDFSDIVTLHVEYDDTPTGLQGTVWVLRNVVDAEMAAARSMFMKFSDEEVLEATPYGEIIRRGKDGARVYITGVMASEEPGFLFSYNVTSLTPAMKHRLNRERLNVGRATYADRVKMILKEAQSVSVRGLLAEQVLGRATGNQCDEMAWIEVSQMAMNWAHESHRIAFVTEHELQRCPDIIDNMRRDQNEVVVVSDVQKAKLDSQIQTGGPLVRTLDTYTQEYNESFRYQFVDRSVLTKEERQVFDLTDRLLALVGLDNSVAPRVLVSSQCCS